MIDDGDPSSQPEQTAAGQEPAGAEGVGQGSDGPAATTAQKQRGRPFQKGRSGNPRGRRPGAKHKMTLLAESMVGKYSEQIVARTISLGVKDGNPIALKMLFDRVFPQPKDRAVHFALVEKESGGLDIEASIAAIARGVADGSLTPSEAAEVGKLITLSAQLAQLTDMEARLRVLEEAKANG